ncbi:recombinase family protein [Paenibacillus pinisoli]|uniref:Recombinase family protein n=1 Tax=Paenibacillus pinisoli TaxID=1276110 RepID=A0A3A6PIJ3_9BACL|nr:recombinase family protein [Paenibacillus pinisoli]RJX40965.1 recombinase family protein [Paenibacillus pinisoli]
MLPSGKYCAYLRKSRSDLEAEGRGEEETYVRHERTLIELSKRIGIVISEIYRERPVSGERISERPEMIRLLQDVEEQKWTGVLVVEVERLARGDTMDQGIVAQAFKYSDTLIVTPMRTYNPNDPNDEEYFEFGLFMSRREFKTITRRLQSGRVSAVKEGKYTGNVPPYGYQRIKLPGKGYSLEPNLEQAPIVQLIFSLYTDSDPGKRKGTALIAKYLNEVLKVPTMKNGRWIVATINGILRNPVYIGKVRWKSRPQIKRRDGKSRPRMRRENWIEADGLHEPIISEEVFNKAHEIMQSKSHPPAPAGKISNPLAGLVKCGMCNGAIVLRPHNNTPDSLICPRQGCRNVGSYLSIVEEKVIHSLKQWLESYRAEWEQNRPESNAHDELRIKAQQDALKAMEKRKKEYVEQKNNLHDLLEQKVYSIETFIERSKTVEKRMDELDSMMEQARKEIELEEKRAEAKVQIIPQVEHVLSVYFETEDPAKKNALLRTILDQIIYTKHKGGRWSGAMDKFELLLYPKISKNP